MKIRSPSRPAPTLLSSSAVNPPHPSSVIFLSNDAPSHKKHDDGVHRPAEMAGAEWQGPRCRGQTLPPFTMPPPRHPNMSAGPVAATPGHCERGRFRLPRATPALSSTHQPLVSAAPASRSSVDRALRRPPGPRRQPSSLRTHRHLPRGPQQTFLSLPW